MFEELSSADPRVKYGAAKALLSKSKTDPASLYPHAGYFVGLLDSERSILKWTAIDVIGNLARVDVDKKVQRLQARLTSFLGAGDLITANHAISALASFATAFPERRETIAGELMKVEQYTFDTDECRNIALGKVIEALAPLYPAIQEKGPVLGFAQRQAHNSRNATAKKAQAFLKRHGRGRDLVLVMHIARGPAG